MANNKLKSIFSLHRLKFKELWEDATSYVKRTYSERGQEYTTSSPFSQLMQVILHLSRMIFYYIEDSITELNIKTANRPSSIRGLATLTGHDPFKGLSARGVVKFSFNNRDTEMIGQTVMIPNYCLLTNSANGLTYTVILPAENAKLTLNTSDTLNVNVVQGEIEVQQATGTGTALQSFNFAIKRATIIDEYYINVYVNGVRWPIMESIRDMTYDQPACMVKTGINGGLDVFFGNGYNGKIPPTGSSIMIEYLLGAGNIGNISESTANAGRTWSIKTPGMTTSGESADLNEWLNVASVTDMVLGADVEDLNLTRVLAPHQSRSFVLANKVNYEYFLKRLNIFSIVDIIKGFETFSDTKAQHQYDDINTKYNITKQNYITAVNLYGAESEHALELYEKVEEYSRRLYVINQMIMDSQLDDNTIYMFLIPDIRNRIEEYDNYFTCPESVFKLSQTEKMAILDLIEKSGQKVLTIDNKIIQPLNPRFAINIILRMWEGSDINMIYQDIIHELSEYFIENTRRDRIPQSDIVRILENINGIDSVNVSFDADRDNISIYKTHYGIDDYGDIILSREVKDYFGNSVTVRDIYPLIRGGFINIDDVSYSENQTFDKMSAVNVSVSGITSLSGTSIKTANIVNKI